MPSRVGWMATKTKTLHPFSAQHTRRPSLSHTASPRGSLPRRRWQCGRPSSAQPLQQRVQRRLEILGRPPHPHPHVGRERREEKVGQVGERVAGSGTAVAAPVNGAPFHGCHLGFLGRALPGVGGRVHNAAARPGGQPRLDTVVSPFVIVRRHVPATARMCHARGALRALAGHCVCACVSAGEGRCVAVGAGQRRTNPYVQLSTIQRAFSFASTRLCHWLTAVTPPQRAPTHTPSPSPQQERGKSPCHGLHGAWLAVSRGTQRWPRHANSGVHCRPTGPRAGAGGGAPRERRRRHAPSTAAAANRPAPPRSSVARAPSRSPPATPPPPILAHRCRCPPARWRLPLLPA
jgi:hypothetical protein